MNPALSTNNGALNVSASTITPEQIAESRQVEVQSVIPENTSIPVAPPAEYQYQQHTALDAVESMAVAAGVALYNKTRPDQPVTRLAYPVLAMLALTTAAAALTESYIFALLEALMFGFIMWSWHDACGLATLSSFALLFMFYALGLNYNGIADMVAAEPSLNKNVLRAVQEAATTDAQNSFHRGQLWWLMTEGTANQRWRSTVHAIGLVGASVGIIASLGCSSRAVTWPMRERVRTYLNRN